MSIAKKKFMDLAAVVNSEKQGGEAFTPETLALGFLSIANATMVRPIRKLSEGRGYGATNHNLGSFGGAGGQHAVFIARNLGIRRALVPRYSSILSAYGMALADVVVENQAPVAVNLKAGLARARISTCKNLSTGPRSSSLRELRRHVWFMNASLI